MGIYYRTRQEAIEFPAASLAVLRGNASDNKIGSMCPPSVWTGDEEVKEMAMITSEYGNMTISLLKYPRRSCWIFSEEEEHAEDTVDHFERRFRR